MKHDKLSSDVLVLCVSLVLSAPKITPQQVKFAGSIIKRLKPKPTRRVRMRARERG